jgi:hypothetical protein
MAEKIDVHDLPEEEIKFVEKIVELLKEKVKREKGEVRQREKIAFATWPLGVKGRLTRREIYDYL